MRAFHLTWSAFFVCFFAWFAVAPLLPVIREDLDLTKDQIANINIAAVCVTIVARLLIGPLCDRFGARLTYTWLLALGAIPVAAIAFAQSYEAFLFWRLLIGAVGAPSATPAGGGNAGGGATQAIMPLIFAALTSLGLEASFGWRVALLVPGLLMLAMAVAYFRYAKDTPSGDLNEIRQAPSQSAHTTKSWNAFIDAARDYRVWLLFITYGACFGVELTIHNLAAVYYVDRFGLSVTTAGFYVGCFGLLALFARALGGLTSDRIAHERGLDGRVTVLFLLILMEGVGLIAFAQMNHAGYALVAMLIFGLFTHMACGATYALAPFVNRKALGGVAGIVGAGGNVGAVAAGFLVKGASSVQFALVLLGTAVAACALCALAVRFTHEQKLEERRLYSDALAARAANAPDRTIPDAAPP
jgi:MFS transporter, NNP family, nitrate/nitrite transporter